MSHKRKGMLKTSGERWKHLRPDFKRLFWKAHRQAENRLIRKELKD